MSDEKYGHNSSAVLIKISWSSVSFDETNLAYPRASMGFSQLFSISSVKKRKIVHNLTTRCSTVYKTVFCLSSQPAYTLNWRVLWERRRLKTHLRLPPRLNPIHRTAHQLNHNIRKPFRSLMDISKFLSSYHQLLEHGPSKIDRSR